VKGATGQTIDNETLGGARTHNELSGVAHYRVADDQTCIAKIREFVSELPASDSSAANEAGGEPLRPIEELYDIIPEDHRQPYDVRKLLECLLDDGHLDEFPWNWWVQHKKENCVAELWPRAVSVDDA